MKYFLPFIILFLSINSLYAKSEIEIYNEIYSNISNGDVTEAIKLCKKQIKKQKKNPSWQYLLGEAYLHSGDFSMAIETLSTLPQTKDVRRLMQNCIVADSLTKNPSQYSVKYMGDSLNTAHDNIWPTLTPTEDIFFTTVVVNNKMSFPQEDIYYSLPMEDGRWTIAKALPAPLNTEENEGSQSFSADGKYMFLVRCNQKDGYGSCDIYYCMKKGDVWTRPINAGKVINTRNWESTPSVSADFSKLYFSSNQKPNVGAKDIFVAEIAVLADGHLEFFNVKNLGDSINTIYDETAPFIHADGVTLYYSSNCEKSMGGLDVFFSQIDSSGNWSRSLNMGYPLNTTRDNFGFCTNLTGDKGYISSLNTNGENMVIYEVSLPKSVRPLPTLLIKNNKGNNFSKITDGIGISLDNVLFDFNESTLLESSKSQLDKLAKIMLESQDLNVEIIGHTDSIGSVDYNLELSMKRAISVGEYIVSQGVSASRMQYFGKGASEPIAPNNTDAGRVQNRRIEFKFYSTKK